MDRWDVDLIVVMQTALGGGELRSLARDVERGLRRRLFRGVYVDRVRFDALPPTEQHRVRMAGYAATCLEPPVFSHWSAAVAEDLPFLGDHLGVVHTITGSRSARSRTGASVHLLALPGSDVVEVDGLRCTSPARTVVDVACASGFDDGLVLADAALHSGLVGGKEMLREALAAVPGRKGAVRAAEVVEFADGDAESPGESLGRHTMHRMGVEPPLLQWRLLRVDGVLIARLDFFFPSVNVGAEFDGRVKYFDPRFTKGEANEVLYREKLREDEARRHLAGLARFGWREARSVDLLRPILAGAGVRPRHFVLL
ncbi:hypothetical protein [uncultured Amnibacterium sp.]|uniref:hypothetical protein n=1 Tax=uncultured Amnibacterium sp. TaxID=1631851 RepID=UPI0035CAC79E